MVPQGENIHIDKTTAYGIHNPMFVCDSTTPLSICTFKCFWLSNARKRMLQNIGQQCIDAFHDTFVANFFPIGKVFFGLGKNLYFHKSSSLTTRPLPFLISSSPWRRISTISGEDIIYSVSSIACFWAEILFRAFRAFFISPSSSAIMLSSRKSSAFTSIAVIAFVFINSLA